MAKTLEEMIAQDRERLTAKRAEIFTKQQALEEELGHINAELKAVEAYEALKTGRPLPASVLPEPEPAPARKARDPNAPKRTRAPRGEGQSIRARVLEMIRSREGGASAADLYAFMEAHDKPAQQQINNALAALKKDNAITQAGRRQPYTAVENPQADQEAA